MSLTIETAHRDYIDNTSQIGEVDFNKSFIPIFSIPTVKSFFIEGDVEYYINKSENKDYLSLISNSSLISKYIFSQLRNYWFCSKEDIKRDLKDKVDLLKEYILNIPVCNISINNITFGNYSTLFKLLNINYIDTISISNNKYLISKGFVAIKIGGKYIPLISMMIKKEYITYYKQCLLLDISPLGEVFEMWVNKDFITTKGSVAEGFRRQYNKHILPLLKSKNIKVIIKDTNMWKGILRDFIPPVFKTIRQEKEWKIDITTKFLTKVKEDINPQPIVSPGEEVSTTETQSYLRTEIDYTIFYPYASSINAGEELIPQIERLDHRVNYNPIVTVDDLNIIIDDYINGGRITNDIIS